MNLDAHIESVQSQLEAIGVAVGGEAEQVAPKLGLLLAPALKLAFQQVLSEAAASLNDQLEGTATVNVQLEGANVDLSASPAIRASDYDTIETPEGGTGGPFEGPITRFTLRVPEGIKASAEAAAGSQGLSLNAWFLRAATRALSEDTPTRNHSSIRGWLG